MRRILAIAAALVLVLLIGGFLSLGAFPPRAPAHPVHQLMSNDKLSAG